MKKTLTNTLKIHQGSTLIEILLYLVIFSTIITTISYFAVVSGSSRVRGEIVTEVDYQGTAILDLITQSIRNSTSITQPAANTSASSLTLITQTPALNPTIFDAQSDGVITRTRITEGPPAISNFLTNSHVNITNLTFTNVKVTGSNDSIQIKFTLTYLNPAGRKDFDYQKTFYGAATRR